MLNGNGRGPRVCHPTINKERKMARKRNTKKRFREARSVGEKLDPEKYFQRKFNNLKKLLQHRNGVRDLPNVSYPPGFSKLISFIEKKHCVANNHLDSVGTTEYPAGN
ncbi:hypothetical protein VIGAN_06025400 [Vigna angularis var. angularis]|uniref:Uncharacterized protein n=1 Tax=Vigna angularis var. angularis TaxID=157739 RepID=A0A0S3S902_PHAAN|nr:hypothetical protein VIGAN_06025400 [Vigna angularis var. angularis]